MTDLLNFIRIEENGTITGNIASPSYDLDLTGEPIESTHLKAPVFKLHTKTPRGRSVEIGGIWKKKNRQGSSYYTLSVNIGHSRLNANLGRFPGQDDENLLAIIPWY
ncbi:DUF736 family protein [Brucella pituitosa]|uniref:DUF736 family protein n=1 Tax=Brucella pituitosa TaxID=571256 RepID=UPI0009A19052|nr:DUF736 family protein [Brucella pituitosa]